MGRKVCFRPNYRWTWKQNRGAEKPPKVRKTLNSACVVMAWSAGLPMQGLCLWAPIYVCRCGAWGSLRDSSTGTRSRARCQAVRQAARRSARQNSPHMPSVSYSSPLFAEGTGRRGKHGEWNELLFRFQHVWIILFSICWLCSLRRCLSKASTILLLRLPLISAMSWTRSGQMCNASVRLPEPGNGGYLPPVLGDLETYTDALTLCSHEYEKARPAGMLVPRVSTRKSCSETRSPAPKAVLTRRTTPASATAR